MSGIHLVDPDLIDSEARNQLGDLIESLPEGSPLRDFLAAVGRAIDAEKPFVLLSQGATS